MPEFATLLFEHLSAASIIVFFGIAADYFSTPEFKKEVATWISGRGGIDLRSHIVKKVLTAFLDGFLYRIYGTRLFSVQFFMRSCGMSLIFLSLAVTIQKIYFHTVLDELTVSDNYIIASVIIIALVGSNFCVDYLSNVQTISLLRMAAESGRILDAFVVFIADIALTVTLFTLLFPIGIVGSAILVEIIRPPMEVSLKLVTPNIFEDFQLPLLRENTKLKTYTVEFRSKREATKLVSPYAYQTLAVGVDDDPSLIRSYSEILKSGSVYFQSKSENDREWLVEIKLPALPFNWRAIRTLYYSAYRQANITRDEFLGVLQLHTLVISLAQVYDGVDVFYSADHIPNFIVKCAGGEIKARFLTEDLGCELLFGVASTRSPAPYWDERKVLAGVDHFPISPFFFTSFASSLLYYFAILLVGFGVMCMRGLGTVFSIRRLETTTKPFALLSVILFVIVELAIVIIQIA